MSQSGEQKGQHKAYGPRDLGRGWHGLRGQDYHDLAAGPEDLDARLRNADYDRDAQGRNAPRLHRDGEGEFKLSDEDDSDDSMRQNSRSDHAADRHRRQGGVQNPGEEGEGEDRYVGSRFQFDQGRQRGRSAPDEDRDEKDNMRANKNLRFDGSFNVPDKVDADRLPQRKDGPKEQFQVRADFIISDSAGFRGNS